MSRQKFILALALALALSAAPFSTARAVKPAAASAANDHRDHHRAREV